MAGRTKTQKLHNYTKFMELLRSSISTKQYNAISIVGMCGIAQISTNASKALIKNGYILKGTGRTFKAADSFATLSVGELMEMVTNYYADWEKEQKIQPGAIEAPQNVQEAQKTVDISIVRPEQLKLPIEEVFTAPVDKILRWEKVVQDYEATGTREEERAIADRAKVPGGWILRMYRPDSYNDTVTFVSDPKHTWA